MPWSDPGLVLKFLTIECGYGLLMAMLTELENNVLAAIQEDIPLVERPYLEMAQQVGISEEVFLATLKSLCQRGVVRRFGATIRHQKSGFEANAMTAWQVDENDVETVGMTMARYTEVSHCYRRNPTPNWPYNLYTMIHGRDAQSCFETARKIARETGVDRYTLLFSRKEMKKTSRVYFPSHADDR